MTHTGDWREKFYDEWAKYNNGVFGESRKLTEQFISEVLEAQRKEILMRILDEKDKQYEPSTIVDGLIADLKFGDV